MRLFQAREVTGRQYLCARREILTPWLWILLSCLKPEKYQDISICVWEILDYHAMVVKLLSCLKPEWFQNISICGWDLRFWRLKYENCRHVRNLGTSRYQYQFVRF